MFAAEAFDLHPLEDSLEQWQGADVIGAELEAVRLSVFARADIAFGAAWCGSRALGQGVLFGHCGSPQGGSAEIGGRLTRGPSEVRGRQDGKVFAEIILLELW